MVKDIEIFKKINGFIDDKVAINIIYNKLRSEGFPYMNVKITPKKIQKIKKDKYDFFKEF